jgi:hypothetical protein
MEKDLEERPYGESRCIHLWSAVWRPAGRDETDLAIGA